LRLLIGIHRSLKGMPESSFALVKLRPELPVYRPRPEFLILGFEVEIMHCASQVFRSLQLSLDKGFVDDDLRRDVGGSLLCQASTCFRIGSKLRCMRSTPTDMQSMSENDFECFGETPV
jgi:hypothetical protein